MSYSEYMANLQRKDVGCAHCLEEIKDTGVYMVKDDVWAATGLPK